MTTRRTFIEQATAVAAAFSLGPALDRTIRPSIRRSNRRHLELALDAARWIEASRQTTKAGFSWPADPLKPESVEAELYNGMAGVVVFYAELYRSTGDKRWLAAATGGADHLIAEMTDHGTDPKQLDAGLYTGLGGLAFTFASVARAGGGDRYRSAARRALDLLVQRATTKDSGVEWNDSNDIISGNAGTGLALLFLHHELKDERALELARKAGRRLLATAEPAGGGLMWYPSTSLRRNMPNFSHGTAGVSYFLATLAEQARDPAFLDAAIKGAGYLDSIATRQGDGTMIFHHEPDGKDLYYLSWCHGPAGTARLFYRLWLTTKDPKWMTWVQSLAKATLAAGIPEQRTPGYWNNISQCCGNMGVGQFFLDLDRSLHHP
ncbi:MAG: lanthionine synthetase LanC family protein, partial [Gemmatimonadota bacterium]